MKIHEFQGKEILRTYGVAVPDGRVARTPDEAQQIAEEFGGVTVVKAQIHAGGRGKGGGGGAATSERSDRDASHHGHAGRPGTPLTTAPRGPKAKGKGRGGSRTGVALEHKGKPSAA